MKVKIQRTNILDNNALMSYHPYTPCPKSIPKIKIPSPPLVVPKPVLRVKRKLRACAVVCLFYKFFLAV